MHINIGDVLWQLFNLGLLVLIVIFIVQFFRSAKQRKTQLDRIESKIDAMNAFIKKRDE
ncbi:DUF4083 domain-containing protein [Bacillus sp. B190/17]|uniref:DUF4083 domain-containing protein n=1 Tax=Bacillus lumedeiriae TaxID=3058829 RepID=A0ABW8I5W6_9BACI